MSIEQLQRRFNDTEEYNRFTINPANLFCSSIHDFRNKGEANRNEKQSITDTFFSLIYLNNFDNFQMKKYSNLHLTVEQRNQMSNEITETEQHS